MLDHSVHQGNPADGPLLVPAMVRIQTLLGQVVRAVTADRGYGEAKIDHELRDLGVRRVVIPRKGKPSQARREAEHGRGFRRLVKWRTGCEGRISYLKRRYGLDRTLFDTVTGAQTWCGLGVLAHNSVKIAALVQASGPRPAPIARTRRARPARSSALDAAATGRPLRCSTTPPPDPRSSRSGPPGRHHPTGRTPNPGPKQPQSPHHRQLHKPYSTSNPTTVAAPAVLRLSS